MICPHCGAQIPANANFCQICGKSLNGAPNPSSNNPFQNNPLSGLDVKIRKALDTATDALSKAVTWVANALSLGDPTAPSYKIWAFLSAFLLFLPTGAVAIYYSFRVDREKRDGRYSDAVASSRAVKLWIAASAFLGFLMGPAFLVRFFH